MWYVQTNESSSERFASRLANVIDRRIILMSVGASLEKARVDPGHVA